MERIKHQFDVQARNLWLLNGAVVYVMAMGAGNLFVFLMTRGHSTAGDICGTMWLGTILSQAGLVAMWLALGKPGALLRLAGAAVAIPVLAGPFLVGYLWHEVMADHDQFNTLVSIVLTVPLFLAAATAPLWLLRVFLGWHVSDSESPPAGTKLRQFSIRSLISLTTSVAVLLGCGVQAGRLAAGDPLDYWFAISGWSLAFFILSTATLIPCVLLLSRYPLIGIGFLAVVMATLYGIVVWFYLALVRAIGAPSGVDYWAIFGLSGCPFVGFLAALCLPLAAVRGFGYRLVMGRRNSKSTKVLSSQ